ncbi:transposase [Paenibacillus thiaminolyticus]|uniref:transposase n=1 Tax=Paenibacillus thiaminolyticus TaxID=49283 RepID=UPI002DBDBFDE|nr:transposase [Paenibacillus thiaminolyticus]
MGDIRQFRHAKQLVAYAGLDPSVYSSGKFIASSNRITKRGSKRLRRSLYLAVQCGLRQGSNRRLVSYYERKKKEGKPYKVTVIACANKLLHHIYARIEASLTKHKLIQF